MKKIAVVGTGNVGTHLFTAFSTSGDCEVVSVSPRTLVGLPADADLYLICVKDDVIASVTNAMPEVTGMVAHTSGSVGIDILSKHKRRGVFYPLQTFTKDVKLDYSDIPVFVEGNNPDVCAELRKFASLITETVEEAGSEKRAQLHLAAVFACNFTNYLYGVAEELLSDQGLDFHVLLPLIRQSVEKVAGISPRLAQTGPAARRDKKVMEKHLGMLASNPDYREIYNLISKLIAKE